MLTPDDTGDGGDGEEGEGEGGEPGRRTLALLRWGLVPFWAEDPGIGNRMIDARSETVASKPAFRASFPQTPLPGGERTASTSGRRRSQQQAALPHLPAGPPPLRLRRAVGSLGGWRGRAAGQLHHPHPPPPPPRSLTLHDRMPVILTPDAWDPWLDPPGNRDRAAGSAPRAARPTAGS